MSRRRTLRSPSAAQDGSGEGDIDLTPMLDVVFIMLIFFIVTSTFVKEPGAEISRVEAANTSACVRGTIIFAVDAAGKIHYDKKEIPLDRAFRLAEAAKAETPEANFVIQADTGSSTAIVSEMMTILKPLGRVTMCVSTDEKG
ncbi:MAG: ExbD/TolR family protein [Halioglobus sp.]